MGKLRVNFSKNEAESAAREIPPSGAYLCNVTEIKLQEVRPGSQNAGKPYWNIQFVIQEGKYSGSSLYSNIMLFSTEKSGTLSSLSQFLKALGFEVTEGEMELPDEDELQGKPLVIVGKKLLAGPDRKSGKELPDRFQVSGYKKPDGYTSKSPADSSILP